MIAATIFSGGAASGAASGAGGGAAGGLGGKFCCRCGGWSLLECCRGGATAGGATAGGASYGLTGWRQKLARVLLLVALALLALGWLQLLAAKHTPWAPTTGAVANGLRLQPARMGRLLLGRRLATWISLAMASRPQAAMPTPA